MKKAFDQTVRDIKRGVNKKVLKVPSIEQKVLDATSNEPWGPHGSLLADIAQATRNYHEYQMIMSVLWKRINDTGKNWRHVYKALTVLEYMVANGSERVIDEIREHAYQISTLSDFQYIDSTGRDQGSNVRKKSQSLVALVNDKERIQEVRQKAATNRDKFRNTAGGGMYRPGYDDDRYEGRYGRDEGRYGSRDEDRNGYGREREWGEDKYGRYGDSYGRDGDRYGEERYSRDGYRDEEYRGRSRSVDGDSYGPRSRSADRDRERAYEDDGQYSYRGSNARAEDQSQDGSVGGRRLERKYSEQSLGAPPSYEDVVGEGRSPVHSERDGETSAPVPPKSSSPVSTGHQETAVSSSPVAPAAPAAAPPAAAPVSAPMAAPPAATSVATPPSPPEATSNQENGGFDEFDPRGSFSATAPAPTSGGAEMDLLGSLADSFSSNALALVPSTPATSEADAFSNSNPGQTFVATSSASSQSFEDPFGDGPFRAIPSTDGVTAQPPSSFNAESLQSVPPTQESGNNFGFGDTINQNSDILADILPPSGPSPAVASQTGFPSQAGQPSPQTSYMTQGSQPSPQTGFPAQSGQPSFHSSFPGQPGQPSFQTGQSTSHPNFPSQGGQSFPTQGGQSMPQAGFLVQGSQPMPQPGFPSQGVQNASLGGFPSQLGSVSQAGFPGPGGQPAQTNGNFYGGFQPQGSSAPVPPMTQVTASPAAQYNTSSFYQQQQMQSSTLAFSQPAVNASTGSLAIVPQQPVKEKFETKSTVWADTLNRGLVNLNISGPKTNPLSDIGVDFEAINRKEKRMEKQSATPVVSNITMGKAMGSGSGIGRAGAGAIRPAPNPMMGGPGAGPGFGGGYGGVNQPMGMNNMPQNMGMGMNMGQGFQMQQPPAGFPPGSNMPGNYNPMMGRGGGYGQQPYGSYR